MVSLAQGALSRAREAMSWLSRGRRRRRRVQDVRDARLPLDVLLARRAFGRGRTERAVEIPWVLGRLGGAPRMLDIGFTHAPPEYQAALMAKNIPVLHGVDVTPASRTGVHACGGDVRVALSCRVFRCGGAHLNPGACRDGQFAVCGRE